MVQAQIGIHGLSLLARIDALILKYARVLDVVYGCAKRCIETEFLIVRAPQGKIVACRAEALAIGDPATDKLLQKTIAKAAVDASVVAAERRKRSRVFATSTSKPTTSTPSTSTSTL